MRARPTIGKRHHQLLQQPLLVARICILNWAVTPVPGSVEEVTSPQLVDSSSKWEALQPLRVTSGAGEYSVVTKSSPSQSSS